MNFEKIVDLHCHILPGIDDGSPDLEHSLQLAREAVVNGVTHILATPHHLDRNYTNYAQDVTRVTDEFQTELDKREIELTVFPSQEVHIDRKLLGRYNDLLGIDEDKRYMLLEFPHDGVPRYAKNMIFNLKKMGTISVIAHPERNHEIQNNLNILYDFIKAGALAQITATSYVGDFGSHIAEISHKLVEHNLVQIVASDAHALRGRKFVLSEALNQIAVDFGEQRAIQFEKNAESLINGEYVAASDYTPIQKKKKFWFF